MSWLSILVPTIRPEGLAKLLWSLHETVANPEGIEVILGQDLGAPPAPYDPLVTAVVHVEPGTTIPKIMASCLEHATGPWVMLGNDDVTFETKGWDGQVLAAAQFRFPHGCGLIHVDDNLFGRKLCTFPIMGPGLVKVLNLPTIQYKRYKLDDHIHQLAEGAGQRVFLPGVRLWHNNFVTEQPPKGKIGFPVEGGFYVLDAEAARFDNWVWGETRDRREREIKELRELVQLVEGTHGV